MAAKPVGTQTMRQMSSVAAETRLQVYVQLTRLDGTAPDGRYENDGPFPQSAPVQDGTDQVQGHVEFVVCYLFNCVSRRKMPRV